MICDECETVAHCMKTGCLPHPVNLDSSTCFVYYSEEKRTSFLGEVAMLKWLVENRSKDYWEYVANKGEPK